MKILYMANMRMPTEKAHGIQIMKTCEAFAELGHRVTLIVPSRRNTIKDDPFQYYQVRKNFQIQYAWSWDVMQWGRIGFFIQYATFSITAAFGVRSSKSDLIYGRDELVLLAASVFSSVPMIWESHDGTWNIIARVLVRRLRKLVVVSKGAQQFYAAKRVPGLHIKVVPNGIDLEQFSHPESLEKARQRLGLPYDRKIAMYIGRLDGWKGTETLYKASALLPHNVMVAIIGGEEKQVITLRHKYPHIAFLGYRPYHELSDNQASADVLVLPNTGRDDISVQFTSPLKLFTYMASGVPLVVSDLPSIREVLDGTMAYFVPADEPAAIAAAIMEALGDKGAIIRARRAQIKVQEYSWNARARNVLSLDIGA